MKQGFSKEVYKEVPCSTCGDLVERRRGLKKVRCYKCRMIYEKAYRDARYEEKNPGLRRLKARLEKEITARLEKRLKEHGSFLRRKAPHVSVED